MGKSVPLLPLSPHSPTLIHEQSSSLPPLTSQSPTPSPARSQDRRRRRAGRARRRWAFDLVVHAATEGGPTLPSPLPLAARGSRASASRSSYRRRSHPTQLARSRAVKGGASGESAQEKGVGRLALSSRSSYVEGGPSRPCPPQFAGSMTRGSSARRRMMLGVWGVWSEGGAVCVGVCVSERLCGVGRNECKSGKKK
jgi:hypothetical protein